ncbi:hypothetical protein FAI41_04240 [Acetobacteraceae bacterium]|nr:hypothetical protein FAI41_04240 [Acetobacteraceae bacterium]
MIPSQKIFVDFYQAAVFQLGNWEDWSMLGLFNADGYPDDEIWDKHALEATWRLANSGIADLGKKIPENDPGFLNLASTPSFHKESNWMLTFLDPTALAVELQKKYQLTEFGAFNPEFCKEICEIFDQAGVGFDVPCPYVPNWENQGKYPWPRKGKR